MIRIQSKIDGFRRCGVPHSAAPADYPDDRFSKAEIAILQAEPMLMVQVVADDPPEGDGDKGAGKKGK